MSFNLMYCVSAYPCNEENLNLKLIQKYKLKYKTEVDILDTKKVLVRV